MQALEPWRDWQKHNRDFRHILPGLILVVSTLQGTDLVPQWLAGVTRGQRFGVIPGQSCRAPEVTREQRYPGRGEIQEIRESWSETQ